MSRSRRPVRAALAAIILATGVAAAAVVPAAASVPAKKQKPNVVVVKAFRFRPATLEVPADTKVVWRNRDQIEHTVTSEDGAPAPLDGVLPRAGAKYSVQLTEPGTYEYFCERHPSMRATVVVG